MTNDERDVINAAIDLYCHLYWTVGHLWRSLDALRFCASSLTVKGGTNETVDDMRVFSLFTTVTFDDSDCINVVRPTGLGDYCTRAVCFYGCKLNAGYLAAILCNVDSLQRLS